MKMFLCALAFAMLFTGCRASQTSPRASNLPVVYRNSHYGITFTLPPDWRGYRVLTNEWTGRESDPHTGEIIRAEHGPEIVLRHPQWTASDPHQDIPIRVFTRAEWEDVHAERVWLDAGGISGEIAHNRHYVFAVHSRFNWGELTGWEEAQKIVATNCIANGPRIYPE